MVRQQTKTTQRQHRMDPEPEKLSPISRTHSWHPPVLPRAAQGGIFSPPCLRGHPTAPTPGDVDGQSPTRGSARGVRAAPGLPPRSGAAQPKAEPEHAGCFGVGGALKTQKPRTSARSTCALLFFFFFLIHWNYSGFTPP